MMAVVLARNLSLNRNNCIFEGDSVITIAAMNGQGEDASPLGPVINDIRSFVKDFSHAKPCHVKREANQVAHRLARAGMGCAQEIV